MNSKRLWNGLKYRLTHPGGFFRYGSESRRARYQWLAKRLQPNTVKRRDLQNFKAIGPSKFSIVDDDGFLVVPPHEATFASAAVREANEIASRKLQSLDPKSYQKEYLCQIMKQNEIGPDSEITKLATSPELVLAIANYMGCIPVMTSIQIWYSPNIADMAQSSQQFHRDHEDLRQVKVFVFLQDLDENSGPLTVVRSKPSLNLSEQIDYRMTRETSRLTDDIVLNQVLPSDIKKLTGSAGTLAFVDTSRCFHMGSRKALKPRLVMMIQYLSPFAFNLPWKFKAGLKNETLLSESKTELERLVLGMS